MWNNFLTMIVLTEITSISDVIIHDHTLLGKIKVSCTVSAMQDTGDYSAFSSRKPCRSMLPSALRFTPWKVRDTKSSAVI